MAKSHLNAGLLLLRVGTGFALISHGYPKLFGGEGKQAHPLLNTLFGKNFPAAVERSGPAAFAKGLESMEIPQPEIAAYASAATEFGGGVALALGLATPLTTAAILFNMLVAIRKAHWANGFSGQGGFEMAGLFALISGAIMFTGPGRYSLDYLFRRTR
ncbi:MAG TPA: DoxX family protein [Nitrolancea sp.]|jgi:putative oxidoreductase|nr:DoxX family protein [Nitrolancea sp.]